jgi:predicted nucleic acid-binding protein
MSFMTDRIFVDTNLLVYAHDHSAGAKHRTAQKLIQELWESKAGCLSIQVLQEFYVSVTQKVPKPMDRTSAAQVIQNLAFWRVHEPKTDDVLEAIHLQERYQISFWDAMIIQSALHFECSIIWSEDLNPGQVYDSVKLVNPLK